MALAFVMNDSMRKRVTVLLAVHNGMPYLREAVDSVLSQTLRDFEFLIIDDGSTDETPQYLRSIGDPRLRVERVNRLRLAGALQYGLEAASGTIVARMDADDIALPNRLERQLGLLTNERNHVLVGSAFHRIETCGSYASTHNVLSHDAAIRHQMLFMSPFPHPCAMFCRDTALDAGGYRNTFDVAEDFDLWSRMARRGSLGSVSEPLVCVRVSPNGVSRTNQARQVAQCSEIAARNASLADCGVSEHDWKTLHGFIVAGQTPEVMRPRELVNVFSVADTHFYRQCVDCRDDYSATRERFRSMLRWRVSDVLRRGGLPKKARREWFLTWLSLRPSFSGMFSSVLSRISARRVANA